MNSNASDCLVLGVGTWMPHMITSGDTWNPTVTGTMLEVIEVFARKAQFCYRFVMPEDRIGGMKLPNGSWTGMMKLLTNEVIDFTALALGINPDRALAIDISEYLYVDEWTAAFQRPRLESDILGYVKPYHHWAWLGVLLCMMIFTVVLFMVQLGYNFLLQEERTEVCPFESNAETNQRRTPKQSTLFSVGFWSLASILAQSSPRTTSGGSVRVLCSIWLLMSFILATVYRSNLKAMLILPKVTLPFDNLEELAESGLQVWVPSGSVLLDAAKKSPKGSVLSGLQKQFIGVEEPYNISWGVWGMTTGKFVFTAPASALAQITHTAFSKTGRCDTYAISENFLRTTTACILMPKGSPWKAKLDPIIIRLRESGILDHIYKGGVSNSTECLKPASSQGTSSLRPMDLGDFYGVFMVYAGGLFTATVSFALEIASATRTIPTFKMMSLGSFLEVMGNNYRKGKIKSAD